MYDFPIRVPAYLLPGEHVVTMHGEFAWASFFAPWSRDVEPYIRIATGDYPQRESECGRDDALASFIHSMSHEVVHYQQWVKTGRIWERGVEKQADKILELYAQTVDRP